jgi:dodecin
MIKYSPATGCHISQYPACASVDSHLKSIKKIDQKTLQKFLFTSGGRFCCITLMSKPDPVEIALAIHQIVGYRGTSLTSYLTGITMTVAKILEITSSSKKSFEDAISQGIARASETVSDIQGAWVQDQKVVVSKGKVTEFRVVMKVTFVLSAAKQKK